MVMTSCHGQILREQNIRRDIGTPHVSPENLKGLVRDRLNTCILFSACVDSDKSNYNAVTDYSCEDSPCHGQDGDFWIHNNNWSVNDSSIQPSSASRRRQSRILDQWAARQAREMITTIERQACEAELMALSSVHPVSARSSSFLQETSPPRLECSVELPNLRASSLVQMWRELEAEATVTRESSISSTNSAASTRTYALSSVDNGEEPSGSSEVCDSADERSDSFTDADSDVATPSESERGRVFDLVRRLNLGSPKINPFSSCSDEPPREEQSPSDRRDNMGLGSNGNRRLIRGRQATKDLLVLINRGRQRELARLFEQCAVSRFSHRSRIQALLKFRLLQREVVVQERKHPTSTSYELDQLQLGTSISRLRERFSSTSKKENCSHPVFEGSSSFRSVDSERSGLSEQLSIENNHHDIEIATRDHEGTLSQPNSLPSTSEDLQEEACQRSELSLKERNLNNQNLDWQDSMNTDTSLNGDDWEGDAVAEEPDTVTEEPDHDTQNDLGEEYADGTWSTDDPHPQSGRAVVREAMYQEWLLSMSDNDEIRELLDRRTVSTTLASGFKERMDQMILSHLRGIANQSIDDSIATEEYHNSFQSHDHSQRLGDRSIDDSVTIEEDHGFFQLHNHLRSPDNQTIDDCVIGEDAQNPLNIYDYEVSNDNQVPYISIQLPLPSGYSRYQGNLAENSSFMHQSPHLQLNLYDPSLNHLDDHSESLVDPSINGSVTREENHNIFQLHDNLQSPTNQAIDDRNDDSQVASSPIQLPLSSRYSQCRGHLQQNSSFMPKSPHCSLEMELIHELRGDVVQLHQEMCELRRSIESCINMQTQLKNAFNQDVSTAACHSGGPGDSIRKGSCCICYEMQVDSLLYRCGHMCTCFKCAHELQWSSGTCPICRTSIVDVVRAYSDV